MDARQLAAANLVVTANTHAGGIVSAPQPATTDRASASDASRPVATMQSTPAVAASRGDVGQHRIQRWESVLADVRALPTAEAVLAWLGQARFTLTSDQAVQFISGAEEGFRFSVLEALLPSVREPNQPALFDAQL